MDKLLDDFQKKVIDEFKRQTEVVSPEVGEVTIEYGPDAASVDVYDAVTLWLTPRQSNHCNFSVFLDGLDIQIMLARFNPYFLNYTREKEALEYFSCIQDCLKSAIHGEVKEIRWSIGHFELKYQLYLKRESGKWELINSGFSVVNKILRFLVCKGLVKETEILYEPYY